MTETNSAKPIDRGQSRRSLSLGECAKHKYVIHKAQRNSLAALERLNLAQLHLVVPTSSFGNSFNIPSSLSSISSCNHFTFRI